MNKLLMITASLAILAAIVVFITLKTGAEQLRSPDAPRGYEVQARFDNVGHLGVGARVAAGGVEVGRVTDIDYDFESYEAVVTMVIAHRYDRFPVDTSASILTTGLTGEQYVGLQPGAENKTLRDGDTMDITSSALVLEQIIGQFLYNMAQDNDSTGAVGSPALAPGF